MFVLLHALLLLLVTVTLAVVTHRVRRRRQVHRTTQHWIEAIRTAPEHGPFPTLGRVSRSVETPVGSADAARSCR